MTPYGICWTSATTRCGTWRARRAPSPPSAAPTPGATTLTEAGRVPPPLVRGDWSAESGYRAGLRLADEPDCTAVFAANDQMALGLLRALHERGRRVPDDISVIGFDDIPESASFLPPLTTIHQDFAQVGRLCVEGVLDKMRQDGAEHGTTLVPTRLVRRESTGARRRPG